MQPGRGVSRRDFFKLALISIAGASFAACQVAVKTPEPMISLPVSATSGQLPLPIATDPPKSTAAPTSTALACPRLLTPADGAKVDALGKVTFSWEPMPEAASYWLEIRLPTGQLASFETTSASRDQYLEAFRTAGKYQWQVTAVGRAGELLCVSEAFTFETGE